MATRIAVDVEAAERIGFSPERLKRTGELLTQRVERREIPGGVLVAGRGRDTVLEVVAGKAVDTNDVQIDMDRDTLFDLASLTKVCATLPAILTLVEDGLLALDDPLAMYFPSYAEGLKARVTIRHLLTHTSGLPAGDTLYTEANPSASWERALRVPLEREPASRVVYSDIGFILLGGLVEAVSGAPLDAFVRERVHLPLGMSRSAFRRLGTLDKPADPRDVPGYAATELYKETGRLTYGVVHDENAFSLRGVAGHAGLFADAADIARYAQAWVGGEGVLAPGTVRAALRNYTKRLGGKRGLGWSLRGDSFDQTGDLWPDSGFSHTGFTGTSIACDAPTGLWVVLLTNRVHYGRATAVGRLRQIVHNAFVGSLRRGGGLARLDPGASREER